MKRLSLVRIVLSLLFLAACSEQASFNVDRPEPPIEEYTPVKESRPLSADFKVTKSTSLKKGPINENIGSESKVFVYEVKKNLNLKKKSLWIMVLAEYQQNGKKYKEWIHLSGVFQPSEDQNDWVAILRQDGRTQQGQRLLAAQAFCSDMEKCSVGWGDIFARVNGEAVDLEQFDLSRATKPLISVVPKESKTSWPESHPEPIKLDHGSSNEQDPQDPMTGQLDRFVSPSLKNEELKLLDNISESSVKDKVESPTEVKQQNLKEGEEGGNEKTGKKTIEQEVKTIEAKKELKKSEQEILNSEVIESFSLRELQVTPDSKAGAHAKGWAHNGHIVGTTALPAASDMDGYKIYSIENGRNFGSGFTVDYLRQITNLFYELNSGVKVHINEISVDGGGKISSHTSHANGQDVDISYIGEVPFKNWVEDGKILPDFPFEKNWDFIKLSGHQAAAPISYIFMNTEIKRGFCQWAQATGKNSKEDIETLRRIYPLDGHTKHMHLRLKCSKGYRGCRDRSDPDWKDSGCDLL